MVRSLSKTHREFQYLFLWLLFWNLAGDCDTGVYGSCDRARGGVHSGLQPVYSTYFLETSFKELQDCKKRSLKKLSEAEWWCDKCFWTLCVSCSQHCFSLTVFFKVSNYFMDACKQLVIVAKADIYWNSWLADWTIDITSRFCCIRNSFKTFST